MSNLNKVNNGLLFEDDFTERTLMWTISPSDSALQFSFNENGLAIKPCNKYLTYTMQEPDIEEYSCIISLTHSPLGKEDIAGVLLLGTNKEYIECQSYLSMVPSELSNPQTLDSYMEQTMSKLIVDKLGDTFVTYSENDNEPNLNDSISTGTTINPDTEPTDEELIEKNVKYNYIKFSKVLDRYTFHVSIDSYNWIEIGSCKLANGGAIGFFYYSTSNENIIDRSKFMAHNIILYSSKYITIRGIDTSVYEVEIYDRNKSILLRTDNKSYYNTFAICNNELVLNTTTMPIPIEDAKLRIYKTGNYDNTIKEYELGNIYGGDIFTLDKNIGIYIDNIKLNQSEIYDIGSFYRGNHYIVITLKNEEDFRLTNINVKILKYSEYYSGEQYVYIAQLKETDTVSFKDLKYSKSITIDALRESETVNIALKLLDEPRNEAYRVAQDYRFKIIID